MHPYPALTPSNAGVQQAKKVNLDALRRYAVARSLFKPTSLLRAIERLGFVQADPIRAPARAQDLTLRHRVTGYRAGDLERRYPGLPIDEECFVNYGFLPRQYAAAMHPRTPRQPWDADRKARAVDLLAFVRERGPTHPRDAATALGHGKIQNYWGSSQNATTHLLDAMHYCGMLRVVRREQGIRIYGAAPPPFPAADPLVCAQTLIALVIKTYAPLPAPSLVYLARLLAYGAPHLRAATQVAVRAAVKNFPNAEVDGVRWFWPEGENPVSKRHAPDACVRLLTPFDPIVWDRRRFTLLWGWVYKFEAYTPAPLRRFGYYALPLLWHQTVIGWVNVSTPNGTLQASAGYIEQEPPSSTFKSALASELASLDTFLGEVKPSS